MTTYEQSQLIDSWRDGILSGMQMRSVAKIYLERGRREVRSLLRRLPQWVRYRGDPLVGCVEDGDIVRFVSIQHERGDLHLRGVAQWPSDSTAVKPLDSELKGCLGLTGEELWVTALPLDRLFVRQMRIELTKERAIDLALPFQIESRLPFPLDEAVIDWLPVRREGRATEILVVAARKGEVEAHLERWRARGVDPHDVSLVPLGLVELVRQCSVQISEGALLAVGRGSAIVAMMQRGALVAARSIGRCDLAAIGHALLSIPLYRELERSPIFLIGGEREFEEEVARSLGRSVEPLSMEGLLVSGLSSHDLQSWALPIGVALAGGLSRRKKIDLRVGDLRVRRPWWRLRKKLALFAAYGVSAAVALNLLGGRLIARQERALCNDYCQLVRLVGDEEAPLPKTPLAIHNEVTRLERRLSGSTDLFPLAPNVPSASEFLDWLALHPALGQGAAIRIDRVRYFLERYPTIKQPKERYQLRVELDFHAQNSTVARAFHDALLAPNDWVDPKIEVQWRSTASGYRTSFCLRDRTFYPGVDGRTGP